METLTVKKRLQNDRNQNRDRDNKRLTLLIITNFLCDSSRAQNKSTKQNQQSINCKQAKIIDQTAQPKLLSKKCTATLES